VTFHDVPREPWTVDGTRLVADLVAHPGPTVGFRIETTASSVAYLPDHEPALTGTIADRSRDWISGAAIAEDVDILLHDAQYFEDEYEERIGWGHSSVADAVVFAQAVGARRLVLFHHEPRHSDVALERLEARARSLVDRNEDSPALAREGMVVELP
jgi:ribonuclease BN (tRNA processing enzyme)